MLASFENDGAAIAEGLGLVGGGSDVSATGSLVVTSQFIYVLRQDYGNVPSPSFVVSPPIDPVFEVGVSFFHLISFTSVLSNLRPVGLMQPDGPI